MGRSRPASTKISASVERPGNLTAFRPRLTDGTLPDAAVVLIGLKGRFAQPRQPRLLRGHLPDDGRPPSGKPPPMRRIGFPTPRGEIRPPGGLPPEPKSACGQPRVPLALKQPFRRLCSPLELVASRRSSRRRLARNPPVPLGGQPRSKGMPSLFWQARPADAIFLGRAPRKGGIFIGPAVILPLAGDNRQSRTCERAFFAPAAPRRTGGPVPDCGTTSPKGQGPEITRKTTWPEAPRTLRWQPGNLQCCMQR